MKRDNDFNLPDGRIDPEKAFGFVLNKLKSMTPEEISTVMKAPTKFQTLALREEAREAAKNSAVKKQPRSPMRQKPAKKRTVG